MATQCSRKMFSKGAINGNLTYHRRGYKYDPSAEYLYVYSRLEFPVVLEKLRGQERPQVRDNTPASVIYAHDAFFSHKEKKKLVR